MTETTYSNRAWEVLRVVYGLVPLIAGLDKFFNVLTQWDQYLSPLVSQLVPLPASVLMGVVGLVEMAVGAAILTRWTRIGAYLAAAWLVAIAGNLAISGTYLDVAVRDLVMAVGAYTLALLTTARSENEIRERRPSSSAESVRSHAS